MATSKSKTSRDKVRAHRERLREQGLRPLQIWVPDVNAPSFKKQAHWQSDRLSLDGGRDRFTQPSSLRSATRLDGLCR